LDRFAIDIHGIVYWCLTIHKAQWLETNSGADASSPIFIQLLFFFVYC